MSFRNILTSLILACSSVYAADVPIQFFNLESYSQNVKHWLNPHSANYDKPVVSQAYQMKRYQLLLSHLIGSCSPWSAEFIQQSFKPNIMTQENAVLAELEKTEHGHLMIFGENYLPYDAHWLQTIHDQMNLNQFSRLQYDQSRRAIAVKNLSGRVLPTTYPAFYKFTLPGQGYPFDNLQVSSVWAGTPLYVLGETKDHAWYLVLTPSVMVWVQSSGVAGANNQFIENWREHANKKMAVMTVTKVPVVAKNKQFLFDGYVGSLFPIESESQTSAQIMVPVKKDNMAQMKIATIDNDKVAIMPMIATPRNFSKLLTALVGRPYGWGGFLFYNDCSQEMKNIYAAFGIWLPRHSSAQVYQGKLADKSELSMQGRLSYLVENGKPLMTIIYIGGHVVMYVGNEVEKKGSVPVSYQDVWGLSPVDHAYRSIIGKSVFLPLLTQYPQNPQLNSLANHHYFQVSYLDEMPTDDTAQQVITSLSKHSLIQKSGVFIYSRHYQ